MAIRNSSRILQPIHRHLLSCTSSSSAATGLVITGSGSSLSHNFRREATVATSPAPSRSASPVRSNDTRRRSTSFGFPADKRNNPPHFKPTSTKRAKRTAFKSSIQALYRVHRVRKYTTNCITTAATMPACAVSVSPQLLPCQLVQCLYHHSCYHASLLSVYHHSCYYASLRSVCITTAATMPACALSVSL